MNCTKFSPQETEFIENINDPTPRINLSNTEDVRREMSKVYREARASKIATQEATRLVYILTQILKAHELVFIEKRLAELEYAHLKAIK